MDAPLISTTKSNHTSVEKRKHERINTRFIQTDVRTLNGESKNHSFLYICKAMQAGWMNAIRQACHGFGTGNLIKRVICMKI